MAKILIVGAGKIGSLITCLLGNTTDREVHVADITFKGIDFQKVLEKLPHLKTFKVDIKEKEKIKKYIKKENIDAVVSCLPFYANVEIAQIAKDCKTHYFDLTEDISSTAQVTAIATGAQTAFVPQCGLAPGFISIVANDLMQRFDQLDSAKLRVGALPQHVDNTLQYALTWSTDGLINEYGNPCYAVVNGQGLNLQPLEGLELIQLDGLCYEAFNTSGGVGTLAESYMGKIQNLDYKTVRYPGHCEKMRILMNDLKLNQDRETLKRILENAVPKTYQDLVLIYVSVTGHQSGTFMEENYMKKIYPRVIAGINWSAIQIATAAGLCGLLDIVLSNPNQYKGLILQENFSLGEFLKNRFGQYYL